MTAAVPAAPVVPNCITRVAAPRSLTLACGDGNFYLSGLRWSGWGAAEATARGTAHVNDCTPYCAAGRFHTYPIIAQVSRRSTCSGERQYTRLVVRWVQRRPPEIGRAHV